MQSVKFKQILSVPRMVAAGLVSDLKAFSFTPYIWLIAVVHIALFAPSIFLMNDIGPSFLSSVGVDHASMLNSMLTILEPRHIYNQMAAFHSSYYGWTYFFLSFWLLLPVKIIGWVFGASSFLVVFIGLKILHVIYGLLASISFYYLVRKFLNVPCAVFAALILSLGSALFRLNFMFHPENIGLLFSNLAMIYLYDFVFSNETNRENIKRNYYTILFFLVLATLAKPTFFLLTAPLYLVLFTAYFIKSGWTFKTAFKDSAWLITHTATFSLATFFLINPWFFLRIEVAMQRQIENIAFQSQSPLALQTASDAFKTWLQLLSTLYFVEFSLVATALLAFYFLAAKKPDRFKRGLVVFLQLFVLLDIVFTMTSMRTFIVIEYFIPLSCLLILNGFVVLNGLLRTVRCNELVATTVTIAIVAVLSSTQIESNLTALKSFYGYKSSQQYKVYQYIEASVSQGSSIAHDQLAPITEDKSIKDYHYWQHTAEEIDSVHPDYLIFDSLNKFNGRLQDQTLFLQHMIETEPYTQIKIFEEPGSKIEIWQRNKAG